MTTPDLIAEGRRLYERCKLFPETDPRGFLAMVELRNLWPKIELALGGPDGQPALASQAQGLGPSGFDPAQGDE